MNIIQILNETNLVRILTNPTKEDIWKLIDATDKNYPKKIKFIAVNDFISKRKKIHALYVADAFFAVHLKMLKNKEKLYSNLSQIIKGTAFFDKEKIKIENMLIYKNKGDFLWLINNPFYFTKSQLKTLRLWKKEQIIPV